MLLLILCAACLASSAGQTTTHGSTAMETSTMTTTPYSQSTMAVMSTTAPIPAPSTSSESAESVVAILQVVVQSSRELNATTIAPVLNRLSEIIQQNQPVENLSLTVKNITRV